MHRVVVHHKRATNARRSAVPTPSILIADPDADTRTLYRESLASAGCDVVEASDGREALVKALMYPPTLVITEIRLSFINGYALCEVLRCDGATADVPILVVTTEALPAQVGRARQAGADAVLKKPTRPEDILNGARRLLAGARAQPDRAAATSVDAAVQIEKSAKLPARSEERSRTALSQSFSRLTTAAPPLSPPELRCPSCDHLLTYERSEIGGVSHRHPEQWDYYECVTCGTFQHRQRTRTVRKVS